MRPEVVALVAQGMTNAAIAEQLGISEQGVKYHLNQVYAKLELGSREDLIAWAKSNRKRRMPAFAAPVAKIGALLGAGTLGALVIAGMLTGGTKQPAPSPTGTASPRLTVVGSLAAKVVCTGEGVDGTRGTQLYTVSLPDGQMAPVSSERFYDSVVLTADGQQARISASQQNVLVNLADGTISGLPRAAIGLDGYPPGTWSPDGRYQGTVGVPMYIVDRAGNVVAEADYGAGLAPGTPPSSVRYGGGFHWTADSSTFATIQSGFLVLLSVDGHTSVTDITKTLGLDESWASTPMGFVGMKGPDGLVIQPQATPEYFVVAFHNGVVNAHELAGSIVAFGAPQTVERGVALTAGIANAITWAGHPLNVAWQRPDATGRGMVAALQEPGDSGNAIFVVADETSGKYAIVSGPQCDPSANPALFDAAILSP